VRGLTKRPGFSDSLVKAGIRNSGRVIVEAALIAFGLLEGSLWKLVPFFREAGR
jgi:hypothetical protein